MLVDEADALARKGFTYLADPPGRDTWRSHYDDALAGHPWEDDCDGLGSTTLDLLGRHFGMDLGDLYAMEVSSAKNGMADHYVGCAREDGRFYIVGDTYFPAAYRAEGMLHQPIRYRCLSEPPELWRQGAPFA